MGAAAIGGGLGAVGSIYGGIQAQKAGEEQAGAIGRDTQENAKRNREDLESLKKKQTLGFLNSGVLLEGTPLLVLEETERKGSADIQGGIQRGMQQANAARRAGRDAFIGSIFSAGSQATSSFGGKGGGGKTPAPDYGDNR